MSKIIYLDNNATTPLDPLVFDAMTQEMRSSPHNPSSIHRFGQEGKKVLSTARQKVADFLGVKGSEILFTSSGTEAMNLLIFGALQKGSHIIGSQADHACVYASLLQAEAEVTFLGFPSPHEVEEAIRPDTSLIVLSAVNGETGSRLDLEGVAHVAKRAGIPFIVDGVALLGKDPVSIPEGVMGMGFSAHKFHGPQGVGFAFIRSGFSIKTLLHGGGQERKLRSGTENLPGIVGMAEAISLLTPEFYLKIKGLRDLFEKELKTLLPKIEINQPHERVSNVSNIYFPGVDNESLLIALDMNGVAASSTSACSAGALEPSRSLIAMGLSEERAQCSIRFSFSRMNTEKEILEGAQIIAQVAGHLSEEMGQTLYR